MLRQICIYEAELPSQGIIYRSSFSILCRVSLFFSTVLLELANLWLPRPSDMKWGGP